MKKISDILILVVWFSSTYFSFMIFSATAYAKIKIVIPIESSTAFDETMTNIVKRFQAEHNESVELIKKNDSFQVLKTLITGYYSHDLPDLALVQNADIHVLENLKILENYPTTFYNSKKILHEFSSPDHSVRKSLPFQRRIPIWFYNQEWLFKLNLEHEKIPQNFEKLISFWKKIKSKQDKKNETKNLFPAVIAFKGDAALARWSALNFHLSTTSSSPVESTLNWVKDTSAHFSDLGIQLLYPGRPTATEAARAFLDQNAIFYLGDLSQISFLKKMNPFKWAALLPEHVESYGLDFVLIKSDKQKQALHFLDFLYKPENLNSLFLANPSLCISLFQGCTKAWSKNLAELFTHQTQPLKPIQTFALNQIPTSIREEWTNLTLQGLEKKNTTDLKRLLEKLLSTNPQ